MSRRLRLAAPLLFALVRTALPTMSVGAQQPPTSSARGTAAAPPSNVPRPTWADEWQAYAGIASVVVTLFGFIFVYRQIGQGEMSRRVAAHSDLYTHQHQIHLFFVEHVALRPYFFDDRPLPASDAPAGRDDETAKVRILAEMLADFCEHVHVQLPALPADVRPGWEAYLRQVYARSPAVREHLTDKDWYSPDLIALMQPRPPLAS